VTPAGWAQDDEIATPRRIVSLLRRVQPGPRVSGEGMKWLIRYRSEQEK